MNVSGAKNISIFFFDGTIFFEAALDNQGDFSSAAKIFRTAERSRALISRIYLMIIEIPFIACSVHYLSVLHQRFIPLLNGCRYEICPCQHLLSFLSRCWLEPLITCQSLEYLILSSLLTLLTQCTPKTTELGNGCLDGALCLA